MMHGQKNIKSKMRFFWVLCSDDKGTTILPNSRN